MWLTSVSWGRFKTLEDRLKVVAGESFKLASDMQLKVRDLNILLLEVEAHGDTNLWSEFLQSNRAFKTWLEGTASTLRYDREIATLNRLIEVHDDYSAKANAMATKRLRSARAGEEAVQEIAAFEDAAQHLLDLGYELAEAHDESLNQFVGESIQTLSLLR